MVGDVVINRVEIPVYTDSWMKGDRFGEIVKTGRRNKGGALIVHVRLDKSGKTVKVCSIHS
jgi:hypothetical protein